jgi:hypothetical protein
MKKIFILCLPAILMVAACNNTKTSSEKNAKQADSISDSAKVTYQCPMDCEKGKTYAQAGKCPVCEMELEKK